MKFAKRWFKTDKELELVNLVKLSHDPFLQGFYNELKRDIVTFVATKHDLRMAVLNAFYSADKKVV